MIPTRMTQATTGSTTVAEDIVFDKAEHAEQLEHEKERLLTVIKELETGLPDVGDDDRKRMTARIEEMHRRLTELEEAVEKGGDN